MRSRALVPWGVVQHALGGFCFSFAFGCMRSLQPCFGKALALPKHKVSCLVNTPLKWQMLCSQCEKELDVARMLIGQLSKALVDLWYPLCLLLSMLIGQLRQDPPPPLRLF